MDELTDVCLSFVLHVVFHFYPTSLITIVIRKLTNTPFVQTTSLQEQDYFIAHAKNTGLHFPP